MNRQDPEQPQSIEQEQPDSAEQDAPPGVVRVHDDVFVSIASICACQVPGVARVGEAPANQLNLKKLVGLSDTKHGVRLKRGNGQVKEMELFISVKEGYSLSGVAEEVQRSVKSAVEKMTGTDIQRVSIYVEAIEFQSGAPDAAGVFEPEPAES